MKHGESVDGSRCATALREEAQYLADNISLRDLQAGDHICAHTDLGNIALIQLNEIDFPASGESRVVLSFTVW